MRDAELREGCPDKLGTLFLTPISHEGDVTRKRSLNAGLGKELAEYCACLTYLKQTYRDRHLT